MEKTLKEIIEETSQEIAKELIEKKGNQVNIDDVTIEITNILHNWVKTDMIYETTKILEEKYGVML